MRVILKHGAETPILFKNVPSNKAVEIVKLFEVIQPDDAPLQVAIVSDGEPCCTDPFEWDLGNGGVRHV